MANNKYTFKTHTTKKGKIYKRFYYTNTKFFNVKIR